MGYFPRPEVHMRLQENGSVQRRHSQDPSDPCSTQVEATNKTSLHCWTSDRNHCSYWVSWHEDLHAPSSLRGPIYYCAGSRWCKARSGHACAITSKGDAAVPPNMQ